MNFRLGRLLIVPAAWLIGAGATRADSSAPDVKHLEIVLT
jgi:hypothetical protein